MFSAMVVLWFFRSPNFITGWSDVDAFIPGYVHNDFIARVNV